MSLGKYKVLSIKYKVTFRQDTLLCLLFLVFNPFSKIQAQAEFSFQLFFEDALGNKDTVTIGYDDNATSGIDAAFGEIDILGVPWNSTFEVRGSDRYTNGTPSFQSKVDIQNSPSFHTIDIHCLTYPFVVSWDSIPFSSPLLSGTELYFPNIADLSFRLAHHSSVGINEEAISNGTDAYIIVWITDSSNIGISVNEILIDKISFFPNPTQNEFFISLENSNEPNLPFKIVDISGKIVLQSFANSNSAIDISNLPNGYYIVQVNVGEQFVSKPFIVNR
jgi:hypothetical protein